MKNITLLFILLSLWSKSKCQPTVTDAGNKQILKWDSTYEIASKYFRADSNYEIGYYFSIRKQNYLVAEYFKHDDNSYLFADYDTSGWILNRGLLRYTDEKFSCEKIEMYDWLRDPEGKLNIQKDTIFCDGSYRKNGVWKETDSYGMVWKGQYKNGLRQGEWAEGYLYKVDHQSPYIPQMRDYFKPILNHNFVNENEISLYDNKNWQELIRGDWYCSFYQLNTHNHRILQLSSHRDKIKWHFLPKGKIEIEMPIDDKFKTIKKSIFSYRIVDDKLLIDKIEKKEVYQLVKVQDSEITLKILYDYVIEGE